MQFIAKKAARFILIAIAVSALTFFMVNLLPGDIAHIIGGGDATPETIEAIRKDLGLNHSIMVRYFIWLGHVAQGDLGRSYLTHESVFETIAARLPVTLELLIVSQTIALLLALPTGIVSAHRNGSLFDRFFSGIGFATLSIPGFVMALLTIYLFSVHLRWLPATGYSPLSAGLGANLESFILPGLSIAMIEWVVLMRVLRSDMITTLQQNFILMARAKGLPTWKVLLKHALKPSSFTLITILGIHVGRYLGEAVIVETIFALPGIGRLLIQSIYSRDYQMVQGCVLFITIGYVAVNALVDLSYALLDPRIRLERAHG
ncbi:MAG: ABC transporter permease [Desulfosarcinaceae bacterium]